MSTIRLYSDVITGGRVPIGTRSAGHNKSISHWTHHHQGKAWRDWGGVSYKLAKYNPWSCQERNDLSKNVLPKPRKCSGSLPLRATNIDGLNLLKNKNSPRVAVTVFFFGGGGEGL